MLIFLLLNFILFPYIVHGATINADSCSAAHVNAAISSASNGDTVTIPAGSCEWGTNTATVSINKDISVIGAGEGATLITLGTGPALSIAATGASVENIKITADAESSGTMVSVAGGVHSWLIKNCTLDAGVSGTGWESYLLYISVPANGTDTLGVITGATFANMNGEQIFARGPCDSWQTAHSLGGAKNIFVENSHFYWNGTKSGYLDFNANTRFVVRYSRFDHVYIDAHGHKSNTALCNPEYHESSRHWEIYNNEFVDWYLGNATYLRGGTGVVYNNRQLGNSTGNYLRLDDYSVKQENASEWQLYYPGCACDADYPVAYQIGRGINSSTPIDDGSDQASTPAFIWNNLQSDNTDMIIRIGQGVPNISTFCTTYCEDPTSVMEDFIQDDRDYCDHSPDTPCNGYSLTYSSYTCPHPLTGLTGSCLSGTAGRNGYNVMGQNLLGVSAISGATFQ